MMVLAKLGLASENQAQSSLFSAIQLQNKDHAWFSDPPSLSSIINTTGSLGASKYTYRSWQDYHPVLHHILDTLLTAGMPCVTPIYDTQHWSVVHGIYLDGEQGQSGPLSIKALQVNIPEWIVGCDHDDNDACQELCPYGSGSVYIPISSWLSEYANPVTCASTDQETRYVLLSQSATPTVEPPAAVRLTPPPKDLRRPLLDMQRLRTLAQKSTEQHPLWTQALDLGKRLGERLRAQNPLLVQRLDQPGRSYALVPMLHRGRIVGLNVHDAHDGLFISYHTLRASRLQLFTGLGKLLLRWSKLPAGQRFLSLIDLARHVEKPELVWKPCQQSSTPTLPFWRLVTAQGPIYVRVDGPIFTELTTGLHG